MGVRSEVKQIDYTVNTTKSVLYSLHSRLSETSNSNNSYISRSLILFIETILTTDKQLLSQYKTS